MTKLTSLPTFLLFIALICMASFASSCGSAAISYTPPLPFPPITFTLDSYGNISVHGNASLVTELGTFSVEAGISTNMQPEDNALLLIIRHKQNGSVVDTVYKISTQQEVTVVLDGKTTVKVTNKRVVLDASKGNITSIEVTDVHSVNTDMTSTPFEQATPTPVPPTPTPTPKPCCGTVLYQANSTWSGWSGTKEWNPLNGMLTNDGTGSPGQPTILAPYQLPVSDYAVEATIQVVNWPRCCYSQYAIVVRASTNSDGGWQGYSVGEDLVERTPSTANIAADAGHIGNALASAPFDPGTAWHTYRVEVKGNTIKLLIDGGVKFDITDNTYLSGAQVGFWSYEVQLNISSFKIIAL